MSLTPEETSTAKPRIDPKIETQCAVVPTPAVHDSAAKLRRFGATIAVTFALVLGATYFVRIAVLAWTRNAWLGITEAQFAAVVGLPCAALAAVVVVTVLRLAAGPIDVELGGMRFRGAAAPIVFWLLCFVAMAGSIKLLWQTKTDDNPCTAQTISPVSAASRSLGRDGH